MSHPTWLELPPIGNTASGEASQRKELIAGNPALHLACIKRKQSCSTSGQEGRWEASMGREESA